MPRVAVELGLAERVPLHAKVIGIARFGHEARNEISDCITLCTIVGNKHPGMNALCVILRLLQDKSPAGFRTAQDFKQFRVQVIYLKGTPDILVATIRTELAQTTAHRCCVPGLGLLASPAPRVDQTCIVDLIGVPRTSPGTVHP